MTTGPAAGRETAPSLFPAVALNVLDRAGIPPAQWADAERTVATIYRRAGVNAALSRDIAVDPAGYRAGDITILLLSDRASRAAVDAFGLAPDVLAFVPGTADNRGRLIYVFEDRIFDQSARWGVPLGALLGEVIAHEVGHVLLPFNSHSWAGIMRAGLNTRSAWLEFFTDEQAALIRERLKTYKTV